jgi:hypothetical protein
VILYLQNCVVEKLYTVIVKCVVSDNVIFLGVEGKEEFLLDLYALNNEHTIFL